MGVDWNDVGTPGFRIEADLSPNHIDHTNFIWAFTLGEPAKKGWLSMDAINLGDLVSKVDYKKKKERKLSISVVPDSGLAKGLTLFDLPDSNRNKPEKIRIYLYFDETRTEANTVLVFHNVGKGKVVKTENKFHKSLPAATITYTFNWGGDVDIVGQTA